MHYHKHLTNIKKKILTKIHCIIFLNFGRNKKNNHNFYTFISFKFAILIQGVFSITQTKTKYEQK